MSRRAGVSRTTVAEIENGSRDPGLNTLRAVLRGAGLDLDIHLTARDDHDEVLNQTLEHLPESDKARLAHGFERFVQGLADGLAACGLSPASGAPSPPSSGPGSGLDLAEGGAGRAKPTPGPELARLSCTWRWEDAQAPTVVLVRRDQRLGQTWRPVLLALVDA